MKKKKIKKIGALLFILFLLTGVCIGVSKLLNQNDNANGENNQNGTSVIVNQDGSKVIQINGIKKVGDIEISNIQIKLVEKNKSELTATVKNVSNQFVDSTNVEIRALNDKGEVEEIFGGIITELAGYEPNTFTAYIWADITEAKDIEFEKIES